MQAAVILQQVLLSERLLIEVYHQGVPCLPADMSMSLTFLCSSACSA